MKPTSQVVIQAQQPAAVRGGSLPFGLARQARRMSIVVDRATGEVLWTEVRRSLRMRLPTATGPTGPPTLSRVVIAALAGSRIGSPGPGARLVFVAPDGSAIGSSALLPMATFTALWPPHGFAPLREVGVEVVEQAYPSAHALEHAHPGASRHWYLVDPGWFLAIVMGCALAVTAILVVLIGTGAIG